MTTDAERIDALERELLREKAAHLATVLGVAGYLTSIIGPVEEQLGDEVKRTLGDALAQAIATSLNIDSRAVHVVELPCAHFHVTCGVCGRTGLVEDEPAPDGMLLCPDCSKRAMPMASA